MRKVVVFTKTKKWWQLTPDLDLLNAQIAEIENDNWKVVSVTANTHLLGGIVSFTILIESP